MRENSKKVYTLLIWALVLLTAVAFVGCGSKNDEQRRVGPNNPNGNFGLPTPPGWSAFGAYLSTTDQYGGPVELSMVNKDVYEDFLREAIGCTQNQWRGLYFEFAFGSYSCGYLAGRLGLGVDLLFQNFDPDQRDPVQVDVYFEEQGYWSYPLSIYGEYRLDNQDTTFKVVARNQGAPSGAYLIIHVDELVQNMDFEDYANVTVEYAGKVMARGRLYRLD